ncbi:MAG: hypothetical protein JKY42_01335 [Flavobacteriales bacterium]|nr:hypothetical protein [Flavobacteriales bacterium]
MRKISAILVLVVFLTPILGFSVHKHYCGNYLKEVSIFVDSDESNCCGEEEKEMGCCSDEELVYQLDVDYSVNTSVEVAAPAFVFLNSFYSTYSISELREDFSSFLYYKPPILFQDISMLVQSFLI